jgi:hypothetical protein
MCPSVAAYGVAPTILGWGLRVRGRPPSPLVACLDPLRLLGDDLHVLIKFQQDVGEPGTSW